MNRGQGRAFINIANRLTHTINTSHLSTLNFSLFLYLFLSFILCYITLCDPHLDRRHTILKGGKKPIEDSSSLLQKFNNEQNKTWKESCGAVESKHEWKQKWTRKKKNKISQETPHTHKTRNNKRNKQKLEQTFASKIKEKSEK